MRTSDLTDIEREVLFALETGFYPIGHLFKLLNVDPGNTALRVKPKRVTSRLAKQAVASLISRGYVMHVDNLSIKSIVAHLALDPAIGPLDGLPNRDTYDLTLEGSVLVHSLHDDELCGRSGLPDGCVQLESHGIAHGFSVMEFQDYHAIVRVCSTSREETVRLWNNVVLEWKQSIPTLGISEVIELEIGRWRDKWWRTPFDSGVFRYGVIWSEILQE